MTIIDIREIRVTKDEIIRACRNLNDVLPSEAVDHARLRHPSIQGFAVFPVYAPLEIIHAGGLLPVGLFGAGNKLELSYAEARFQSFICSIAKSTLELFLRGQMENFRGAVFSSICDVARNLASLVSRNAPALYIDYLHMPQNMYSAESAAYTRTEFLRFRDNLAQHLDREISDAAIDASLQLYNEVRSLTRRLYAHRRQASSSIAAGDLHAVVQAGTRMMPEDYLPMLQSLCAELEATPVKARDGVHVIIEGAFCEQPPIGLLETIEAGGCLVQDDDMMIGWRIFDGDIRSDGDPLGAIADAYLNASTYTSIRHDALKPRTSGLLDKMKKAGAEAVLFTPAKFCEPALLDYVLFRRKLDESDIPHLKVEFEEKMWTFDATRTEIETFAESMLFE